MTMSLSVAHAAHVGLERETNEDSYLVLVPPGVRPPVDGLLLVADGVGGTNAGEVASGVLVESFLAWFNGHTYGGAVHYNPAHADYFVAGLKDLLENANETLYQLAGTRSEWAKMGTTATVALFSNDRLFLGHVGDTRAYLLRDGALSQLTADHSWVAEEVAAGRMTPAEAQNPPRRNVISRVLGNGLLLRVDRQAIDLKPQDVVILTSDGLTGLVGDAEIQAAALGSRSLQEACDRLIATANSRGGHDNSTVLAARPRAKTEVLNRAQGPIAFLIDTQTGRQFPLSDGTTIGSGAGNDVILDETTVSGQHAKVKLENGAFALFDLASTNGTTVNGAAITHQVLADGDRVQVGRKVLTFKVVG